MQAMVSKAGILTLVIVMVAATSWAQPVLSTKNKRAIELYTEADNFRVRGEYAQALGMLQEAVQKDKNFSEAYFRIALIYKTQRQYDKAIAFYHQGLALNTDVRKQKAYFLELGEVYQFVGEYEKSLQFLNRYLDNEIMNKRNIELAAHLKRNSVYALKNQKAISDFRPQVLSDTVNAFPMQYFPVLTADEQELIFTRRLGGRDTDDEDLVLVRKDKQGRWGRPVSVSEAINSRLNEGTCTISADGRQLIFTSCAGRRGYGSCDLFESRKNGDTWTTPVNLGPQVNSAAWESQPSLSADGNMLFFVSDRRGGLGNKDIYVSYKLNNNQWTRAENLGDKINTPYEEISPFIHVNGRTLFFASNGRPGFGGFDLYRSERENSVWSEPLNFGSPVNTNEDQFSLYITADGKRGFYSHEDNDKVNSSKIVEITIPEELRLRYVSNYVKGIVRDKKSKAPLKARVELFNINQNILTSAVYSDSVTGEYLMVLTQGADYALYVNSPGYLFQSLNFNYESDMQHDPVAMDIYLDPAELGATAVLNNIFFEFNKFDIQDKSTTELDKVVRFMTENAGLRVEIGGHTDNAGTTTYNLQLSQKRSHAVAQYLIDHGIAVARLVQKGYGAEKPIRPNDTEENRQINRRIEFRIVR
jgi:outer membrane protein OmpA-like peptidoglycan-associated protein/tetratricopeptide (TPR) repeat protein